MHSIWQWRRLVREVARRDFRARYAGSVLGGVWALLEPALQFGLYLMVFGYLVGTTFVGTGGVGSYVLYLVTGLIPFLAFQECLIRATGLVRAQAALVRHVNVPVEVLLAGALLSVMARYAVAMALVLAAAAAWGMLAWAHLGFILLAVLLLATLTWGLTLALVPAGAFIPDVGQVVVTVTSVLFFLTPIVYRLDSLGPRWVRVLRFNPLTGLLDVFRTAVTGSQLVAIRVAVTIAASVVVLFVGSSVFARHARAVRDVV